MLPAGDILSILGSCADFGMAMKDIKEATKKDKFVPNPYFVQNGISGPSPHTDRNLFNRKLKGLASTAWSALGSIGSAFTAVNTADIAKHGSSSASTAVHLYRLRQMAEKVKDGGSLRAHLDLLVKLKAAKLGARGVQLTTACIPIPGVSLIGTGAALGHQFVYVKSLDELILRTAWSIHWRAYRELVLLRGSVTAKGPAVAIARELCTLSVTNVSKRTECLDVGSLHSVEKLNRILMEPAGYLVLQFKMEQT